MSPLTRATQPLRIEQGLLTQETEASSISQSHNLHNRDGTGVPHDRPFPDDSHATNQAYESYREPLVRTMYDPSDANLLPSQLAGSYQIASPPVSMYAEDPALTTQSSPDMGDPSYPYDFSNVPDPEFANVANDMVNKALGRTPNGNSVLEPDSVLGESGRLYHGFKHGKYFLPNDAVRDTWPDVLIW